MDMTIRRAVAKVSAAFSAKAPAQKHPRWVELELLLDGLETSRVAVVTGGGGLHGAADAVLPDSAVRVSSEDLSALHVDLTHGGPFDLVVDLAGARNARERVGLLLGHLKPGGQVLARLGGPAAERQHSSLTAFAGDLRGARDGQDSGTASRRDYRTLVSQGRALRRLDLTAWWMVVECTSPAALARFTEPEFDALVARNPKRAGIVTTATKSEVYEVVADLLLPSSQSTEQHRIAHPALAARTYNRPVCSPRMAIEVDSIIVPESFRNPWRDRGGTPALKDHGLGFARYENPSQSDPVELSGVYYHLDNTVPDHFGHVITECAGRLWALEASKDRFPDLKFLISTSRDSLPEWHLDLLDSLGVGRSQIVLFNAPVRPELLVSASPAYVIGNSVHQCMTSIYAAAGARLRARSSGPSLGKRVFLTRPSAGIRACRNMGEVESLFEQHGFVVLEPSALSMPDQAAALRDCEVLAGFGGSAMFQVAMAPNVHSMVAISNANYHLQNEKNLAALLGIRLTLVQSNPETTSRRFSGPSFHSPYTVDMSREGLMLAQLLDGL